MSKMTKYDTGKQGEIDSLGFLDELGYAKPNKEERKQIVAAFVNIEVYLKPNGFDVLKKNALDKFNFDNKVDKIVLYELKTAGAKRKSEVKENFSGLGFTLTKSEIHNAKQLGTQYKFLFLNLKTKNHRVCMLKDFFNKKVSRIYPTWSVFITAGISEKY